MLFRRNDYGGTPRERRGGGSGGSNFKRRYGKDTRKIRGSQGYGGGGGGRNNNNNYNNNNNNNNNDGSGYRGNHHNHRGSHRGRNNFNRHHPYSKPGNRNYDNNSNNRYHQKEELPLLSRTPVPPALHLLKETKKRSLTDSKLTPVEQVKTLDDWVACYFQDYHIRYDQEEKKWERTDSDEIVKEPRIPLSGKLIAEYYERYYTDYDGWCQKREDIANGTVGTISVPRSVNGEIGPDLGLGFRQNYRLIYPLPSHFTRDGEEQAAEAVKGKRDSEDSDRSRGGCFGEVGRRDSFHLLPTVAEDGVVVRHCRNADGDPIGIDGDNDLILRTPHCERFPRSGNLSPDGAKRPLFELGFDGNAHVADKKLVGVASEKSKLPQFWRNVASGKTKLPSQFQKSNLSPSLFVEYRIPYFVYSGNGRKKIFLPEEGAKICSEERNGGYQFLKWAAKQYKAAKTKSKLPLLVSPTSTASPTLSPRTPLTAGEKRQRQRQQQEQQQSPVTIYTPVPIAVPVANRPLDTILNGEGVKAYLGEYIGKLNRAGPPDLPEEDLETILVQALRVIDNSLPPGHKATITYEKLLQWYHPIADSVAQFKRYRSLIEAEQKVKNKKIDQRVAKWRKRFWKEGSDDET